MAEAVPHEDQPGLPEGLPLISPEVAETTKADLLGNTSLTDYFRMMRVEQPAMTKNIADLIIVDSETWGERTAMTAGAAMSFALYKKQVEANALNAKMTGVADGPISLLTVSDETAAELPGVPSETFDDYQAIQPFAASVITEIAAKTTTSLEEGNRFLMAAVAVHRLLVAEAKRQLA